MSTRPFLVLLTVTGLCILVGCIRAQNYHPGNSVFHYHYSSKNKNYGSGYFEDANVTEAYIEFDARGSMYRDRDSRPRQLEAALNEIHNLRFRNRDGRPHPIALYIFIHGWKNNASEDSNNVWGFRRFLSAVAHYHDDIPVVGLYIGWPGASLKNDKFLSFWNREPVADSVGDGELVDAMRSILQAVKGPKYADEDRSIAIVIGHSFGGIVLERVATKLLREQLNSLDPNAASPADLFVLINEAGAASIARPFLFELGDKGVTYNDNDNNPRPLLLSMTSTGDAATKFAYAGGEYLSLNRPNPVSYSPPDRFGQTSSQPYDLLTAANMIALQSHEVVQKRDGVPCELPIELAPKLTYCMNAITKARSGRDRLNNTPYWIMQLPELFVPDHSSVFQDHLLILLRSVACRSNLTICPHQETVSAFARSRVTVPTNANNRPKLSRSR